MSHEQTQPVKGPKDAAVVGNFCRLFYRLGQHPDKILIDEVVAYAGNYSSQAYHIAQAVVSRFMDTSVPGANKLTILYVMDAIMKRVSGYPYLFSRYIVDVVQNAMNWLPTAREQTKLDFLVQTWDERKHLQTEALQQIVQMSKAREGLNWQPPAGGAAIVPQLPPPSQNQPYLQQTAPARQATAVGTAQGKPFIPPPLPPTSANAQAVLLGEMQIVLLQILQDTDMNFTLADVQVSNPAMYVMRIED